MKKSNKIFLAVLGILACVMIPVAVFLGWDVLVQDRNFDGYTLAHAIGCTAGLLTGIGIARAFLLLCRAGRKTKRRIRKWWDRFLYAMMLDDNDLDD